MIDQTRLITFLTFTLLLLIAVICPSHLSAQEDVLPFHNISTAQNLSSGSYNYYIYKDSRGFVWISSINGLNRYDGQRIRQYVPDTKSPFSLMDHNIQGNFFEDNEGALWFCTATGIHKYIRANDDFERYHLKDNDGVSIKKGYRLLYLDNKRKELWIRAGNNLFIQPTDFSREAKIVGQYNIPLKSQVIQVDTTFTYLVSPKEGLQIHQFRNGTEIKNNTFPKHELKNHSVSSVFMEDFKIAWVGTENGLLKFDLTNNSTVHYNHFNQAKVGEITGIEKIDEHTFLIATKDKGIFYFDSQSKQGFVKKISITTPFGISTFNYVVERLYLDKDQTLWIHTPGRGVFFCNLKKQKFKPLLRSKNNDRLQSEYYVRSITQDSSGRLFCLTREGIEILSKKELDFQWSGDFGKDIFDTSRIHPFHIYCDNEQHIWIGSSLGLYQLVETGNRQKLQKVSTTINNSNENTGFTFFHQLSNGQLLAATTRKGVVEIEKGKPGLCSTVLKDTTGSYSCIFEDSEKNIFFSNETKSILIYKLIDDQMTYDTSITFEPFITSILEDKINNRIWVSTLQGLYSISKEAGSFSLKKDTLLPFQTLNAMLQDSTGRLWLSSNKGLISYHPEKNQYQTFALADGLQSSEFNFWASHKTKSQQFIFGGVNGINIFNPLNIKSIDKKANPIITHLRINGEEPDYPLRCEITAASNISEIKKLVLKHWENNLTLEFAALEYSDPSANQFAYQMVGINDTFININGRNSIQFGALSPNIYTLQIKATNSDGVWSPNFHELQIVIRPPWYKTKLAYFAYFLLLSSISYFIYKNRINQIQKAEAFKHKEIKYKQLVAETETAVLRLQMNPHFIFNSMNSISRYILEKDIDTAHSYLARFAKLMRMILELAKEPFLTIAQELELLKLYLETEAMRFEDQVTYSFNVDDKIDPYEDFIPTMILQPFIENAIWHGLAQKKGTKTITISFEKEEDHLILSVEDNGIGRQAASKIKKDMPSHESKALAITRKRLKLFGEAESANTKLDIIDLKGEFNNSIGTKVIIQIPII
ncbi:MAG: ligand-binding sensor domain-containing protein [Polaribacter sp.]|jgi:ligand-binding sensor domain-containing protein